jgi:NADH-quinone oxidoreductase subunit A
LDLALGLIRPVFRHIPPSVERDKLLACHCDSLEFSLWAAAAAFMGYLVDLPNLPPLFVYGGVLVGFVVTNLLLAHLLGPRKHTPVKDMPYESGMDPIGDARQPFDVRFYLVAILFLVFDVELLFLYPWAVSAYSELGIPPELRDTVFGVMLVFMATLSLAWVYAWRKGVFRWR